MMHTPTIFINVLRGCGINYETCADIRQVLPPEGKQWNDWVWQTSNGNPYLVLKRNGVKCSISRVRRSKHETWKFKIRWPYPSTHQKSITVEYAHQVGEFLRTGKVT